MLETGFADIIKKIADERGKDIFLEPKKMKALLFDYAKNEFKKESSFFLSVLDTDSIMYINRAENLADCKQFLIKRLDDEYGLSPSKSAETLDLLFLVLCGKTIQTQDNTQSNKGQYTITSKTNELSIMPRNDAKQYYDRALKHFRNFDYDSAIADYTKAIRIDPDDAVAYYSRGFAYRMKGDYDSAIADYTNAIRIDPNDAVAYRWRSNAYEMKGDYDSTIADYTNAIRIDPDDAVAYRLRGDAYRKKGDYDSAIADYAKAIRINPDIADAYLGRGVAYREEGDYDSAIADYTEAIRIDLDDADAYYLRGDAYKMKGDYKHSEKDFTKAIELGYVP
ncbi:MAG: tetratricopeptide repeat protein [Treponema sp.]|jgi:tetratricopeptide (TPR) repeat protein|nr:tetratricopeptide repeat protein [Treponema sp.]